MDEKDYLMDILSIITKYKNNEFEIILNNIQNNIDIDNYTVYLLDLRNIVHHFLNSMETNNYNLLIDKQKTQESFLLVENINNYNKKNCEEDKIFLYEEFRFISTIINNMYDSILYIISLKNYNKEIHNENDSIYSDDEIYE